MTRTTSRPRARDIVIVGLLIAGLLSGIVLVIVGGSSDPDPSIEAPGEQPVGTVPSEDVSLEAIERWSGLDVPDGARDFLTARLGTEQLDLTFTMAAGDEDGFVSASSLPSPVEGERLIMHSSPLWQLNPGEDDAGVQGDQPDGADPSTTIEPDGSAPSTTVPQPEIRATSSTYDGVLRVVELVDEGPDTVRARIVLAPA